MSKLEFQGSSVNDLIDLVDIALVFAGINAASEVIAQYQSWRQSRQRIGTSDVGDLTFAEIRRDLLLFVNLMESSQNSLLIIASSIDECVSIIDEANPEILGQLGFLNGHKAGIQRRDRTRYRDAVDRVFSALRDLIKSLDDAAELVSRVTLPASREELLESARLSAAEHQAIRITLMALADEGTSFSDAVGLTRQLMTTASSYLGVLRDDALGIVSEPQ